MQPAVKIGGMSALEDDNAETTDRKLDLLLYRLQVGVGICCRFLLMEDWIKL